MVYFVGVHSFLDGNGRMSRVIMASYLVRQGYLPIVIADLERSEYLKIVSDAMDGRTEELCTAVVGAEVEMMDRILTRTEYGSQDTIDQIHIYGVEFPTAYLLSEYSNP